MFVTTRSGANAPDGNASVSDDPSRETDPADDAEEELDLWDDVDDVDLFDLERAADAGEGPPTRGMDKRKRNKGEPTATVPPNANLPAPLMLEEIAEEQKRDAFCQTVLSRQSRKLDSAFFEDDDGLLKRKPPSDPTLTQVVVPETLRARLLTLCHTPVIAGHPGQNRMYYAMRRSYYWPNMAVDIAMTVRN